MKNRKIKKGLAILLMFALIGGIRLWKGAAEVQAYQFAMTGASQTGTVTIEPVKGSTQVNGFYGLGGYQVTYTITKDNWTAFDDNFGGYFYIGNQLNVSGGCSFGYHHSGGTIWESGAVQLGSLGDGQLVSRCDVSSGSVSCTFRVNSLSELPAYIVYAYEPASSAYLHLTEEYGSTHHVWYYRELRNVEVSALPNLDTTAPALTVSVMPAGDTATVAGKIWAKSAVIKASAKDDQARPGGIGIYLKGKLVKEAENSTGAALMETSYTVNQNGTYQVRAYDKLNNASDYKDAVVSCIDIQAPVIKSLKPETEELCRSTLLTVEAADAGCGLAELAYSWNGGAWSSENKMKADHNGSYSVKVRDALGNETESRIDVTNIDDEPPAINCRQIQKGKTARVGEILWSTEAEMEIEVSDKTSSVKEIKVLGDEDREVLGWKGDKELKTSVIIKAQNLKNGNYKIIATDMLGNKAEKNVKIMYVDNLSPVINKFETERTKEGLYRLVVTARDNEGGCGLAERPYSFDGGKTWQSEPYLTIGQNGTYKVIVRDALNLQSTASVKADSVGEKQQDAEKRDEVENKEKPEKNKNHKPAVKEKRENNIAGKAETADKKPDISVYRKTVSANEAYSEPEKESIDRIEAGGAGEKDAIGRSILIVLGLLFALGALGLLLYLFLSWLHYSCLVYGIEENGGQIRLCRLPVKSRDGEWQVKVPDHKLGNHGTGQYLFVFHPAFVKEESPCAVIIFIDGRTLREQLEEEISVSI
ncbi:MAG: hypothetical protein HDR00_01515 [Lachnospiraceae bacterium]|nr:hypothetical protein [Lachnospiraceae bacterium]